MMTHFDNHNIQELPLSVPFFRNKVVRFLGENGLRLEAVDSYYVIEDSEGHILAGAGLSGDVVKCVAVAAAARSEGLAAPLLSEVVSRASAQGITCLKVFTKPENEGIFQSLGFHVLARAPKAILMENGRGLETYCAYLQKFKSDGRVGVVVMNANPFTLGHRHLLEQAAARVDRLFVIPVKEDVSRFPYVERKAMIEAASAFLTAEEKYFSGRYPKNHFSPAIATPTHAEARITVLEGSDYVISAATFPTYFLKDLSDAAETQMRLDVDLYSRWIAPALGATVRFVGSEPFDALTARYNTLIPNAVEIHRLNGISASRVRKALDEGHFQAAAALCPPTTYPYLLADLAEKALRQELDTPLKPGLVGPDSNGAHKDMDYALMRKGIAAIRPFFPRMAQAASAEELRSLGIEAEKAMMAATGGVNTHRGAIFCLGLVLAAVGRDVEVIDAEENMQLALGKIAETILANSLNDSKLHLTPGLDIKGARQMALGGYKELFQDWLPYYRSFGQRPQDDKCVRPQDDNPCHSERSEESTLIMTLLRIMSTLDDTCIIKRVGLERAQEVKREAATMLSASETEAFTGPVHTELQEMCSRYAAEGVSPGGAADMLALTIFIDTLIL